MDDESLYIVTAINGASVINSFYDESLIVVYNTAVEFYKIHNSLELVDRIPLNAKVSCAAYFESQLLILTMKCQLIISKNNDTKTLDLYEESGRIAEFGHVMIVDPTLCFIACHIYQGLVKIIPVEYALDSTDSKKGKRKFTLHKSPFNVRLKELLVLDMIFLSTLHDPCLVILHQDALENTHIVSYSIDFENNELVKSDLIQEMTLDQGVNRLIPMTDDLKGCILAISQSGLTLISQSLQKKVVQFHEKSISAWEWMDSKTLLLIDHNGSLHKLLIGNLKDDKWEMKSLGSVSSLACINNFKHLSLPLRLSDYSLRSIVFSNLRFLRPHL